MNLMKFLRWVSISLFLCASGLNASPFVYVNSADSAAVEVIDQATGTVIAEVLLPAKPIKVVATVDGSLVFVANETGEVNVVSTLTNTVVFSLPVGGIPRDLDLSADGTSLYVLTVDGTLTVLNTATYAVVQTIANVGINSSVAVSPNGNQLAISNKVLGTVLIYTRDPVTLQFGLTASFTVGLHAPTAIVFKADGSGFFVVNAGNDSIGLFDATTLALLESVCLSGKPLAVAVSPDGSALYVTTSGGGSGTGNVFVVNTATFAVSAAIQVDQSPVGLAVTVDGKFAYVSNLDGLNVSIVDTTALKVSSTVNVGHTSGQLAVSPGV